MPVLISSTDTVCESQDRRVSWRGVSVADRDDFERFVSELVQSLSNFDFLNVG